MKYHVYLFFSIKSMPFLVFIFVSVNAAKMYSECADIHLKKYYPSEETQKIHNKILHPVMIKKLEDSVNPTGLLEQAGFSLLQWDQKKTDSVVIFEHPLLPNYVIKIMRISAPCIKQSWQGLISNTVSIRVTNAHFLRTIIKHHHLRSIKIPQKYFYCIENIPMVLAQKITPSLHRTLKDITFEELKELLHFVELSHGIVNFKPHDIIVADDGIYFIDTERVGTATLVQSITRAINRFKNAINPDFITHVEEWFNKIIKQQEKAHNASPTPGS